MWETVLGGPRRLFMMTGYDSVGHWLEVQKWPPLEQAGDGVESLIEDSDNIIVRPITEALPGSAQEENPGIYTVRTFQIDMRNLKQFIDLSEKQWWPWVRLGEGVRPICQWTTVIAEQPRIFMMTRYNDLSHWEGHQQGTERETLNDPALREIYATAMKAIKERGRITHETSVKILRPLSQRRP